MFNKKKKESGIRVADLDALLARNQEISLHGKVHVLRVPTLETWLEVVACQNSLLALKNKEELTKDELVNGYYEFISKMCPSITVKDVEKCEMVQLQALWQISMDIMNGYTQKKTQVSLMLLSATTEEIDRMIVILNQLRSMPQDLLPKCAQNLRGGV